METPEVTPEIHNSTRGTLGATDGMINEPEILSVPDMVASAALALSAITELVHRVSELYESLQGISAGTRSDLALVMSVLNAAKSKF